MQSRYKVCLAEEGYSKCVFMSVAKETVRYVFVVCFRFRSLDIGKAYRE